MEREDQPSNPNSAFEQVLAMTHEYGSVAKIPDESLAALDYYRAADGTLAPIGHEVKTRTLEAKKAQKPFEPFSVVISSDRVPRLIDGDLHWRLTDLVTEINDIGAEQGLGTPEIINIVSGDELKRAEWLESALDQVFLKRRQPEPFRLGERLLRRAATYTLTNYYPTAYGDPDSAGIIEIEDPLSSYIRDLKLELSENYDDIDEPLPIAASTKLAGIAERERGKLADITVLDKYFDMDLGFEMSLDDVDSPVLRDARNSAEDIEEYDRVRPEINQYASELVSIGIDTAGKLLMLMVGELLDDMFPGQRENSFADDTVLFNHAAEVLDYLKQLEEFLQQSTRQEFRAAKEHLRQTPFGQTNRSAAEERLGQAKQALKAPHRQLLPFLEAFGRPEMIARKYNRLFDELQAALFASTVDSRTYTFRADVDEALDADPGKISGDCTAGISLPFLDPNNSLYNVKVFREAEHIGNIYLLEAKDADGQPLVWHLDAVQIPQYLDWSTASVAILDGLKKQAKARGIASITMNNARSLISNYNYISEAFMALVIDYVKRSSDLGKAIVAAAPNSKSDAQGRDVSRLQLFLSEGFLRLM